MCEINCQSINGAWCTYGFIHSQLLFLVLQLIVAHSIESLLQPVILISDEGPEGKWFFTFTSLVSTLLQLQSRIAKFWSYVLLSTLKCLIIFAHGSFKSLMDCQPRKMYMCPSTWRAARNPERSHKPLRRQSQAQVVTLIKTTSSFLSQKPSSLGGRVRVGSWNLGLKWNPNDWGKFLDRIFKYIFPSILTGSTWYNVHLLETSFEL